ncbi:MAG: SAM-dependent methyltransferase [Chloroflexi bacterium]|nr:MAG: SAM-dependent methyltransferase [Chloroflexota bacterium]
MLTVDHELLGIQGSDRVLDCGCGTGRHSWGTYKQIDCSICALDIGQDDLQKTRYALWQVDEQEKRNGRWLAIRGDATALPFRDATFDKVVCSEVLEHLTDDRAGLAELVRVLKPHGMLAVSVPAYLAESLCWKISKGYRTTPGGHVRIYRPGQLAALLSHSNLRICAVRRKHALHSVYWVLRCIFGIRKEKALIPSLYYRFLVWDLKTKSKPVRLLEDLLNRLFPKSVVIYALKGDDGGHSRTD